MILRGGRAFARLTQITVPCSENRRVALNPWSFERVLAFYSTSLARQDSDSKYGSSSIISVARRTYATDKPVSRPKAHTGRTTTTPRKKAAPKTVTAKKPAATKQPAAKKAVTKKPAAKKPAAKKRPVKRATKVKAKPRRKPKKAAAKPKPKPKRKVLTDEQKAKVAATKARLGVRNLKALALKPPTELPSSAWAVVNYECFQDPANKSGAGGLSATKAASTKYRSLTSDQLEHYNHIANENRAKYSAVYRKWLESYTPSQIREANLARIQLRKRTKLPRMQLLKDDRQVKRAMTAYLYFCVDRRNSGDYRGINSVETLRLIGAEWKALSADGHKKYNDMAAQDMARYEQEVKAVYDRDVRHSPAPSPSAS